MKLHCIQQLVVAFFMLIIMILDLCFAMLQLSLHVVCLWKVSVP